MTVAKIRSGIKTLWQAYAITKVVAPPATVACVEASVIKFNFCISPTTSIPLKRKQGKLILESMNS